MQHKDTFFRIEDRSSFIPECIEGLCYSCKYQNLEYHTNSGINIVKRADWNPNTSKVSLISGGGSGHEPTHSGFVGKGMLTASVCGDVFASPSVNAILKAITLTTNKEVGCLLIVKNYTGDRLNFGLAAEKAKLAGYKIDMVIISDDIALDCQKKYARGIAGTLFIHKIAGYLAEHNYKLEDIKVIITEIKEKIKSIGASLTECCNVNSKMEEINLNMCGRIKYGCCELGLGIHGEPGHELIPTTSIKEIIDKMVNKLNIKEEEKYSIIINNLGGTSNIEMMLITNAIRKRLGSKCSVLIGPAPLMTSIDMKGFSISILPINTISSFTEKEMISIFQEPTETDCWPSIITPNNTIEPIEIKDFKDVKEEKKEILLPPKAYIIVKGVCKKLIEKESTLNELDRLTGDGDTGTTFANAAAAIDKMLSKNYSAAWGEKITDIKLTKDQKINAIEKLFYDIGETLSTVMGGSSGILLAIFFTAASFSVKNQGISIALIEGLNKMKEYGGAKIGDCTMIDALEPTLLNYKEQEQSGKRIDLNSLAEAARIGCDSTINMKKAKAGRAAYINDVSGHVDPGAKVIEIVFGEILNLFLM